jgi:clan AA aspartic protease
VGIVREEITLKNAGDITKAIDGYIKEDAVHQVTVTAVVDTGAITLVIPEDVRAKLGLRIITTQEAKLANNELVKCGVSEPVEVHWKDRSTVCNAYVVPSGNILLGSIPLEGMDLIVNPIEQKLEGEHGDKVVGYLL